MLKVPLIAPTHLICTHSVRGCSFVRFIVNSTAWRHSFVKLKKKKKKKILILSKQNSRGQTMHCTWHSPCYVQGWKGKDCWRFREVEKGSDVTKEQKRGLLKSPRSLEKDRPPSISGNTSNAIISATRSLQSLPDLALPLQKSFHAWACFFRSFYSSYSDTLVRGRERESVVTRVFSTNRWSAVSVYMCVCVAFGLQTYCSPLCSWLVAL